MADKNQVDTLIDAIRSAFGSTGGGDTAAAAPTYPTPSTDATGVPNKAATNTAGGTAIPDLNQTDLTDDVLRQSLKAYNDAAYQLDQAQSTYDQLRADPKADATRLQDASNQADNARTQLGTAARAHSTLLGKLALAYQNQQRYAKDPDQKKLWENEANKAQAQTDLYSAEADLYTQKTQAGIQSAKDRASAALQRAQSYSTRVTSLGDRDAATTALAKAKLANLGSLDQSTINLHNQQIQTAAAHATLYGAQAEKTEAQAQYLIPAQADYYVQRGLLTQQQADQLKAIGPVKVDELQAKLGLEQTRADLIRSQIGRQQILPSGDKTLPTLTEFQPSTGQVTGVPNPSYVIPELQSLKDWSSSVSQVQDMLQNGQLGDPSSPDAQDQATQLIQNLYTSLSAKSKGLTPDQYYQVQQSQANLGRGLMGDIVSRGQNAADQFLNVAKNARGLGGMSFSPYSSMFGAMGGNDLMQQAMGLISQVRPVTDRASAFDALSKFATAKHLAQASQPGGADQNASASSGTPAGQSGGSDQNTGLPQLPTPFAQSGLPEGRSVNG